jgi:Dolichyl-phosphate-mannose-protein mannosyltransferase
MLASILRLYHRMTASSKAATSAVLLLIIMNAAFLDQAFHMDDAIYLILARNVSSNPAFPQEIGVHVEGIWADDLASMEHPPLTAYLLAAGSWLARGYSEIPLHALFLMFPVVLGFSMYSLSRRFTRYPLIATSLLLASPIVFVMSHTLMTDLPHLALWMLAVALFTKGVDEGRNPWVCSGAAAAALASYISPAALCLIPLLVLYALLKRRPQYGLAAILLPLLAQGLWWLANYMHYARFTPGFILHYYFATENVLGLQAVCRKSLYAVLAVGGLTVSPVILFLPSFRKFLALGLPFGMAATLFTEARDYPLLLSAAFVLFFALGFAAIAGSLHHIVKNTCLNPRGVADVFMGLWFFGALLFAVLFHMTGSARYLLPIVPPLVLLAVRQAESQMGASRFRTVGGAAILASALLSMGLGVADFEFAAVYRDFAAHLNSSPDLKSRPIWFTGEWGLRAYLEPLGGKELGRKDARAQPGDLLVVPTVAVPYSTLFDSNAGRNSIILVAPSRVEYEIPPLHAPSILSFMIGMPYWQHSDGLDFLVQWGDRSVFSQRVLPQGGRTWHTVKIPLPDSGGVSNRLILSAQVGASGNADADWIAISHARIQTALKPPALFSLREHLPDARISGSEPVTYYDTPGKRPVFEMFVWLDQERALKLLDTREYRSSWPLRLIDAHSRAGFWSMGWGLLPFSFALDRTPMEEIRVFEVLRTVDGFDEHEPSWYPRKD